MQMTHTRWTSARLIPVTLVASAAILLAVATAPAGAQPAAAPDAAPTFTEHVAPILFANCVECHRPGEVAPFALMTYDDARRRAGAMAAATQSHRMPPWKAEEGDYAFRNARRLTLADIDTIQRWAAAGMPEGDPRRLPQTPQFAGEWELGAPDVVARMPEPFSVPATGPDVYRNFVVPLDLDRDVWVRAVEFRPSQRTVVHHSLFSVDTTGGARALDQQDARPGYAGGMGAAMPGRGRLGGGGRARGGRGSRGAPSPDDPGDDLLTGAFGGRAGGSLGGWAVGGRARVLPDGLAIFVPKGADLVLSTHFHPSGRVELETSALGLYFADRPPTQAFTAVQLPPLFGVLEGIDIPAGEARYTIGDSFVLPVDVRAFNAGAHAHHLGREMKLTATVPGGATRVLLWIKDWDFAWQEQYQFEDFVPLPAGTRLDVTITYDNSASNPHNPHDPPARVTWGEQSHDEMGSMTLQLVTAVAADLPALEQAYRTHVVRAALTRPGLGQLLRRRTGRTGAPRP
jgi:hypothetical protein